jgi:hypothetical protein
MKKVFYATLGLLVMILGCQPNLKNTVKIGTYDSRAVTYAYIFSDMNKELQQKLRTERDEIMKTNDTAKWKETMSKVCTEEYLTHQRFFATGSTASILKKVEKQLPEVAKSAGVDVIVSKWELTWHDSNALIIDLTDSIAQLFTPIEKLEKTYVEIKKMEGEDIDSLSVEGVIEMWQQFEEKYMGK